MEEYRRWELKTINDDHQQFENTLHDCGNLLRTAKRIRVNEASTSSFPSILQTLNDLRHCAPDSLRGNAIASADLLTRPWPLFYLAERYFLENDTPRHERIIAMAHLAHAIYTLPRSHQAEKPWPTDVLMLLSDYELLVPAYIDRHAPEAQWITFIINVQDEFSVQVDRLAADLRFAGPSETFAPFERALSRAGSTVKVRDVLQLYQRLASSIRTSPRLSPKEEFPRTDGLTGLESAMMVNRATRIGYRMVKKLRQDQDRPRRHVGGLRTGHYLRLITLMHEQLDEHTFCQTVGALTRDMEEFGLGPDIGGLVRAASSSVHSACRWSGAVAKAVGNVMARRREVVDKP